MNPLAERPDIRRRVYIAFWGLGLTLGAAQTGYAVAEVLATIAFLVALLIALAVVAAFASRAEQRERRSRDTDHDL